LAKAEGRAISSTDLYIEQGWSKVTVATSAWLLLRAALLTPEAPLKLWAAPYQKCP